MPRKTKTPAKKSGNDYISLGGKSRRYKNVKTGKTISRRQYEKLNPPQSLTKKLGAKKAKQRISKNREANARYMRLVDDYVRNKKREGLTVTKRGVRNAPQFKHIVRDLKGKNADRKAEALFEVGRIRKEEIAQYVERFEKEGGGVKITTRYQVVSKKTGRIVFEGTRRECLRWLAFGTRAARYRLHVVDEIEDDESEEE